MRVVVILPTYNERENIGPLFKSLFQVFKENSRYNFQILVVDDNSPDGTAKVVREYAQKNPQVYLLTGPKRGLGAAYVRGIKYAISKLKADVFFEMDADLSHDPKLIPIFLKEIEKGADLVLGSRYIKGGSIPSEWALRRKIFSVFGNLIVRFGLMIPQIHDWSSGYRAVRTLVFKKAGLGLEKYSGYTFQIAFLHQVLQAGFKVKEVPLNFIDRKYGKSKFPAFNYIFNVLLYIFFRSTFIRFCFVGTIGFLVNLLGLEIFYHAGLRPGPAAALGAELAIISNFVLNNFWTFSHKKIRKGKVFLRKFFQFNLVSVGAVLIQWVVVSLGTSFFGDETRIIFLVLAIVVFIVPYSYFMYNRFIWREKK